jgi:DNA invertase Pin-like site-specific DNA recombinase
MAAKAAGQQESGGNWRLHDARTRRGWSRRATANALRVLAVSLGEAEPPVDDRQIRWWEQGRHTPRAYYTRLLALLFQAEPIERECERRGWELVEIVSDEAVSGGVPFAERPGGRHALELLTSRRAGALVVAKMDRLTRGIEDFVGLHDQAQAERWALVMLDFDLDTTTPTGEFTANIRASAAQFERRLIGQRTREALAQKRLQGIRLGRPPEIAPETEELIVSRRRAGLPLRTIAEPWLRNVDGIRDGPRPHRPPAGWATSRPSSAAVRTIHRLPHSARGVRAYDH